MGLTARLLRRLGLARDSADAPNSGALGEDFLDSALLTPDELRSALEQPALRDQLLQDTAVATRLESDLDTKHARAMILTAWRRIPEARTLYEDLIGRSDATPSLCVDAGWCFYLLRDYVKARANMERGLALDPRGSAQRFGLAIADMALGRFTEARDGLRQLSDTDPTYRDVWLNIGHAELALGDLFAAEDAARLAISQSGAGPDAIALLGQILQRSGRGAEALDAYAEARSRELSTGQDAGVPLLQAQALIDSGRTDAAIALCEEVLPARPVPSVNALYSIALLTAGYFREGWTQFEYRWFAEPMFSVRVRCARPLWNGQSLAGERMLLVAEQGIGDMIQFIRYAPLLKAQGATVILCAHPGLGKLASGFRGVDIVVEELPPPTSFDYYLSLMSLPRVFGTELGSIPAQIPYLTVDRALNERWSQRVSADALRVGIVWSGNPKHVRDAQRSIPLDVLKPLWRQRGVCFCLLQKETRESDLPFVPPENTAIDLSSELVDFADTAAVVNGLDLVVSVDTAVAHLAGALGTPVWLLLPKVADFRWLENRESSPWYPGMRIFRQTDPGNWAEVVDRVGGALAGAVEGRQSTLTTQTTADDSPLRRFDNVFERIPRVCEAREGVLQYIPGLDDEARSLAWFGEYLPHQLEVLEQLIPPDAWVVEVGSGFGSHAIRIARMLEGDAQVFCYEPRQVVQRLLRQNTAANRVGTRAVFPRGTLDGCTVAGEPIDGPVHTIDHLGLSRLDLIKLRSGHVGRVLHGAEKSLDRFRPRLLIDVVDEESVASARLMLEQIGYRISLRQFPLFRPDNFAGEGGDRSAGATKRDLLAVPEETQGVREAEMPIARALHFGTP